MNASEILKRGNEIHEGLATLSLEEMEAKLASFISKPAKPFPRVGDTLTIKHQVKRTSAGDVLGVQRADGKGTSAKITAVYLDGTVRVGHSEVWDVKPGTQGHWETINPERHDYK